MTDHDTLSPEIDDELRARLRAFGEEVKAQTDTEAALQCMPRGSRRPSIGLLAIAACLLVAVVIAAVVVADRQSVDTVPPSDAPASTTECPTPPVPRGITSGGQMKTRFAMPIASAATAALLLSGCNDDDSSATAEDSVTTIATGEDVGFIGGAPGLSDQTMDLEAEERDGEVTGRASFDPAGLTLDLQCADTADDDLIVVGGQAMADSADGTKKDSWVAVIIREGEPDRVGVWFEADDDYGSCQGLLDAVPAADEPLAQATTDIETG